MSFQAMTWAVQQRLNATRKIVLLMLANRTNSDTGKCIPKIKTLSEDCGLSESACKSALKDLEQMGLLVIHKRFYEGQQLPNQYELLSDGVGCQKTHPRQEVTQVGRQVTTESGIESGIESKQPSRASLADPDSFDKFWKVYPKKQGKAQAEKAFAKHKPDDKLLANMIAAIHAQASSEQWLKGGGQFVPMPATWLNGRRWEDEGIHLGATSSVFSGAI